MESMIALFVLSLLASGVVSSSRSRQQRLSLFDRIRRALAREPDIDVHGFQAVVEVVDGVQRPVLRADASLGPERLTFEFWANPEPANHGGPGVVCMRLTVVSHRWSFSQVRCTSEVLDAGAQSWGFSGDRALGMLCVDERCEREISKSLVSGRASLGARAVKFGIKGVNRAVWRVCFDISAIAQVGTLRRVVRGWVRSLDLIHVRRGDRHISDRLLERASVGGDAFAEQVLGELAAARGDGFGRWCLEKLRARSSGSFAVLLRVRLWARVERAAADVIEAQIVDYIRGGATEWPGGSSDAARFVDEQLARAVSLDELLMWWGLRRTAGRRRVDALVRFVADARCHEELVRRSSALAPMSADELSRIIEGCARAHDVPRVEVMRALLTACDDTERLVVKLLAFLDGDERARLLSLGLLEELAPGSALARLRGLSAEKLSSVERRELERVIAAIEAREQVGALSLARLDDERGRLSSCSQRGELEVFD